MYRTEIILFVSPILHLHVKSRLILPAQTFSMEHYPYGDKFGFIQTIQ